MPKEVLDQGLARIRKGEDAEEQKHASGICTRC